LATPTPAVAEAQLSEVTDGVEFIDGNGGGPGCTLSKAVKAKAVRFKLGSAYEARVRRSVAN
jgi:hypothetical protein